jgi:dynein heavy chain, axonemal
MHAVCNQGMRDRHWVIIADETGIEVSGESTASIKYLLDSEITEHLPRVVEISDTASREWSIEKVLGKMLSDWADLAFELAPWKETGAHAGRMPDVHPDDQPACGCTHHVEVRASVHVRDVKRRQRAGKSCTRRVRAAGTFILKGGPVDEAQMLLDDHIIKAQAMLASPFAAPFQQQLVPWNATLARLQETLDNWLKCQSKWIYLEPIFGSDEIMKQIPQEGAAFRQTDAIWRAAMENTRCNPVVMSVADMPNLLENFQQVRRGSGTATLLLLRYCCTVTCRHCACAALPPRTAQHMGVHRRPRALANLSTPCLQANAQLDVVEKGLNDFLDTKKLAFPRFYFLSNDELLEILSEAKDPVNVQPFVKKCFEAVARLQARVCPCLVAMLHGYVAAGRIGSSAGNQLQAACAQCSMSPATRLCQTSCHACVCC